MKKEKRKKEKIKGGIDPKYYTKLSTIEEDVSNVMMFKEFISQQKNLQLEKIDRKHYFDPEIDDPNDPQWLDAEEAVEKLKEEWIGDPEVKNLIKKLKIKHDELLNKRFDVDQLDEISNQYYEGIKGTDVDEMSIFAVIWHADPSY